MSSQVFLTLINSAFESFTNPLFINDPLWSIIHFNRLLRLVFFIELSLKISCGVGGHWFLTFVQILSLIKRDKFFIITDFSMPSPKLAISLHSPISLPQEGYIYFMINAVVFFWYYIMLWYPIVNFWNVPLYNFQSRTQTTFFREIDQYQIIFPIRCISLFFVDIDLRLGLGRLGRTGCSQTTPGEILTLGTKIEKSAGGPF